MATDQERGMRMRISGPYARSRWIKLTFSQKFTYASKNKTVLRAKGNACTRRRSVKSLRLARRARFNRAAFLISICSPMWMSSSISVSLVLSSRGVGDERFANMYRGGNRPFGSKLEPLNVVFISFERKICVGGKSLKSFNAERHNASTAWSCRFFNSRVLYRFRGDMFANDEDEPNETLRTLCIICFIFFFFSCSETLFASEMSSELPSTLSSKLVKSGMVSKRHKNENITSSSSNSCLALIMLSRSRSKTATVK